ncbi:type II CAAX endopeptidase family protein [Roseateles sp.]|uniref:CPBP family intramembrane glutamic endopeptidase n=1 Tax=Roseateles sp. TaxID=1971397 RepID=UPI002E012547|nr:type II CAAX endopeptidase family protein [Roseateles sp.]
MASWKTPTLFLLGAAACVLLYLFLLNFPPTGLRSPTAGVIPVLALATTTAWLTVWALRAQGWRGAVLGLSRGQQPAGRFAAGFLAGTALVTAWMGIVMLVTGSAWHANPAFSRGAVLAACLFHLFNNLGEELVYRGYLFLRLDSAWGAAGATLITSAAFALLHLQAGLPGLSVLAVVFTSALVFGAAFSRWRSLPLALGFHVATNVVQDITGLRTGPASLWMPEYPAGSTQQGPTILAAIGLLNAALAVALLIWPRGPAGAPDEARAG